MLNRVSIRKNIDQGLIQEIYANDYLEIIYNNIAKDKTFKAHSHIESQLVYSLSGEFILIDGDKEILMKENNSKMIGSEVPHSAIATKDFESIDIKASKNNSIIKINENSNFKEVRTSDVTLVHYLKDRNNKFTLEKGDMIILLNGDIEQLPSIKVKEIYQEDSDKATDIEVSGAEFIIFKINK